MPTIRWMPGLSKTPPIEIHKCWAYHMDRYLSTINLSREPCHGWELWVDALAPRRIKWFVQQSTHSAVWAADPAVTCALPRIPAPLSEVVVEGGHIRDLGGATSDLL